MRVCQNGGLSIGCHDTKIARRKIETDKAHTRRIRSPTLVALSASSAPFERKAPRGLTHDHTVSPTSSTSLPPWHCEPTPLYPSTAQRLLSPDSVIDVH